MYSLLTICYCFLALSFPLMLAGNDGFCLQQARSLPVAADATWKRGTRRMPSKIPVLAAHDWPLSQEAEHEQLTANYTPCHSGAPIYRYKVVKGVVYVDHEHSKDDRYKDYRNSFLEMLVLSIWLYGDFPDIYLVTDYSDHPQLCHQAIPFLRFSIFNKTLLRPAPEDYNITELLSPAWISQSYVDKLMDAAASSQSPSYAGNQLTVLPYTRGFTIPSPEAWQHLSMTQEQMQDYITCLDATHPSDGKRPVIFWRGAATGCSRGWPRHSFHHGGGTASVGAAAPAPTPHILRNKRVQLAIRVFPYPTVFDVGITAIPRITPECLGESITPKGRALLQLEQLVDGAVQQPHKHKKKATWQRQWLWLRRFWIRLKLMVGQCADALRHWPSTSLLQQLHTTGSSRAPAYDTEATQKRDVLMFDRSRRHKRATNAVRRQQVMSSLNKAASSGDTSSSEYSGLMAAHAYRSVALMLSKEEAVGMEGWADAAVTLSIDGYGPAYRLPQQLLLGSAVLRMASPYQTWVDWDLVPGLHYAEFAYDLSDIEEQGFELLSLQQQVVSRTTATEVESSSQVKTAIANHHESQYLGLKLMADTARSVLMKKLDVFAQLDAFAWSISRYKEACDWEVEQPHPDDGQWQVLQLDPTDIFMSKGVPEAVRMNIMLNMRQNFKVALRLPMYASQLRAADTAGDL